METCHTVCGYRVINKEGGGGGGLGSLPVETIMQWEIGAPRTHTAEFANSAVPYLSDTWLIPSCHPPAAEFE